MEQSLGTASVTQGMPRHEWSDADWMRHREAHANTESAITIYECHLGSWMRVPEDGNRYLTYAELGDRSEEHTSELQSLMRISYAVFCLKKKNKHNTPKHNLKVLHLLT